MKIRPECGKNYTRKIPGSCRNTKVVSSRQPNTVHAHTLFPDTRASNISENLKKKSRKCGIR